MLPLRFFLPLLALTPTLAWAQFPPEIITALDDAIALYRRVRAERLRLATDTNERGEVLIGAGFFEGGVDPALVFQIGDEAFELEPDRALGLGAAEAYGPPPLPARSRRVHDGERGGLDAGSCRACHFVGGPDGAGAPTQQALFRGDGRHRSTATVRDAPHVMGLGYLARAARELERGLAARVDIARSQAADLGEPVRAALVVDGINFGAVTAGPDGALDATELRGVGPDLRIRPFGHKGRHADLVSLADEALAVHLGIQTEGRLDTYAGDAARLGDGGPFDPDGDGVQLEANAAQAVLLGAYLSLLPVPTIAPPDDPALAFSWSRGRAVLDEVGCTECHRERLWVHDLTTTLVAPGDAPFAFVLDLENAGLEPAPHRVDFAPDPQNEVRGGVPVFAFTDLRRHDLGPALAEPVDEALPDGSGAVPGAVWQTRPLWGLADTGPYLHDGRAATLNEAIEAHGGEAEASRQAWAALSARDQAALRVFLMSLTRAPTLLVE